MVRSVVVAGWFPASALALAVGYIAQWLERLTADQQVPGSNPGVPSSNFFPLERCAGKIAKRSDAVSNFISQLRINVSTCFHPPL